MSTSSFTIPTLVKKNHQVEHNKRYVCVKLYMQTILAQPCKHTLNLHAVAKLEVGVAGFPIQ